MMPVVMTMLVGMILARVRVRTVMCVGEVDIKFHAGDGGLLPMRNVEVIPVEFELLQLPFKFDGIHTEVEQRGDEHVAGDAAENVEI